MCVFLFKGIFRKNKPIVFYNIFKSFHRDTLFFKKPFQVSFVVVVVVFVFVVVVAAAAAAIASAAVTTANKYIGFAGVVHNMRVSGQYPTVAEWLRCQPLNQRVVGSSLT